MTSTATASRLPLQRVWQRGWLAAAPGGAWRPRQPDVVGRAVTKRPLLAPTVRLCSSAEKGVAARASSVDEVVYTGFNEELLEDINNHKLVNRGVLVRTCQQLPLGRGGDREEYVLKAACLVLARRLRKQKGSSLPAAELVHLPAFLQRLQLRDHDFFDDFCDTLAESWTELVGKHADPKRLAILLRGAEDYALLHPTKGTALHRVVAALASSIQKGEADLLALAGLCRAAIQVKSRSVCTPLLEALQMALLAASPQGEAAALTLVCLAELRAMSVTGPVPADAVERLLQSVQDDLSQGEHVFLRPSGVRMCLRTIGLCYWVDARSAESLLSAWLQKLDGKLEGDAVDAVLLASQHLPAPLRLSIATTLLPKVLHGSGQEQLRGTAAACRLSLLSDLPSYTAALGQADACKVLCLQVEEVVAAVLPTAEQGALARCFAAAASSADALRHVDAASEAANLEKLTEDALQRLAGAWSSLSPADAQLLLRGLPSNYDGVAADLLAAAPTMSNLATQLAVLNGAAEVGVAPEKLSKAAKTIAERLKGELSAKDVLDAEVSLRRGRLLELGDETTKPAAMALLAALRGHLFKATLAAEPAWNRDGTPSARFKRYLEQSMRRGRSSLGKEAELVDSKKGAGELAETRLEREVSPGVAAEVQKVIEEAAAAVPQSELTGVRWHKGLQSWEVRVENKGHMAVDSYIRPRNLSKEEIDRARHEAEQRCMQVGTSRYGSAIA
eukprot:TRINITY_DN31380_c0_g1_i1.p1 TRINITY_DN31380_c0_g1~~TRINITY_DN31380_c0_g1_i1.p1  ORF type:complete len:732 (+),score=212.20 TRINITY_DN31380_c0_g1_i1:99-2294(+)